MVMEICAENSTFTTELITLKINVILKMKPYLQRFSNVLWREYIKV